MTPHARLVASKRLHTVAWACFAGCIVLIPAAASARQFKVAATRRGFPW